MSQSFDSKNPMLKRFLNFCNIKFCFSTISDFSNIAKIPRICQRFDFSHFWFQVYIICSVLLYGLPMFIDDYTYSVKLYLLPYILPIIHVALLGSIYSTVALAAERYITICHPFMRYRWKSKSCTVFENHRKSRI